MGIKVRPRHLTNASTHTRSKRRGMNLAVSVLVFGALGLALLAINIVYVTAVWDRLTFHGSSPQLRPFEIVGLDETEAKLLRMAMPRMVIARLNNLKTQTNAAITSLRDVRALRDPFESRPADLQFADIPIPDRLMRPIEIELDIADIKLGWLVSFLVDRARARDIVDVTVAFNRTDNSGDSVLVYGHATGKNAYAFTRTLKHDLREIVNEIAASIIQFSVGHHYAALTALSARDFQILMEALTEYVELEGQLHFAAPDQGSYGNVLKILQPLLDRFARWEDLQWFAALISEKAGDWSKAREYYDKVLTLIPDRSPYLKVLEARIARVRDVPNQNARGTELKADSEWAESIRRLMGVEDKIQGSRVVRIAVVGGAPWREVVGTAQVRGLEDEGLNFGSVSLRNYQTEVLRVMHALAPNGEYRYAPLLSEESTDGAILEEDVAGALHQFVNETDPKPHMILLTLSGVAPSDSIDEVIKKIPDDVLVVVAAGHKAFTQDSDDMRSSTYKNVAEKVVLVGAVGRDGRPSSFTKWPDDGVWAPGEDIPVISETSGTLSLRNGTAFAAALVVGAVSNLMASSDANPKQMRKALKAIAQPVNDIDPREVVNVAKLKIKLGHISSE